MLHLHIFFSSKRRLPALIREPVRVLFSSAHSLLPAARIGVGRIDSLVGSLGIFVCVVKSVTQSTNCWFALFVDSLTPTEKHSALVQSRCSQQST